MAGFVDSFSATYNTTNTTVLHQAIDVFHPSKLPITVSLAEEFAVFDHWYAGVPGPTFPNRYFLMSATSNGNYNNGLGTILSGLPQKSLFQSVEDAGLSWKNYFGQVPTSIAFKDVRNIKDILTKLKSMDSFYSDAKKGTLPNFAQIDPILFSLPGTLLKNIYEALRNGPQWNSTALIITYDEHGGFYDHVPPPQTGVPSPDDISANSTFFRFDRLGVRVPTIVVSPWVAKSRVVKNPTGAYASSYFEHSSVAATVKKLFNLPSYLTKRDAWAAPFDFLFAELSAPRSDAPAKLPDAPYIDLAMEVLDIENEFEELFQVFNAITTGTGI
ncbi:phosphoesterase family-domain-containing protein [Zopfochytrium polystomum]|nr:phosphoesterase family-domain-containing protein [Zopfochytrium polystomum]